VDIVTPKSITLDSSNVAEDTYSDWDAATSYTQGDRVYYVAVTPHRVYEALADTTGDVPPDNPDKWALVGPSNRWAMFDGLAATQTVKNGGISVTIDATGERIALFELRANTVDIVAKDSGGSTLSSETVDLQADPITNWFEYFFAPFEFLRNITRDLPANTDTLDVDINSGGDAECAHLAVGDVTELATSRYGIEVGIQDFSRKERNDFGEAVLVKRSFSRVIEGEAFLADAATLETLASLRSTPVVWDINNDATALPELQLFGFYRDFEIIEETPAAIDFTFDVRSMS